MTLDLWNAGIYQIKGYKAIQGCVSATVKTFGLNTVAEWFTLCYLRNNKTARAVDIAKFLAVEPPFVANLTESLEARGHINKSLHPTDGRVKILRLTPKGQKLVPKIEKKLRSSLENLFKGVSSEEISVYYRVLKTVANNAQ